MLMRNDNMLMRRYNMVIKNDIVLMSTPVFVHRTFVGLRSRTTACGGT